MTSLDDFVSELNGKEMLTEEQRRTLEKARILKSDPGNENISLTKYEREWLNDKELDFALEYHRLKDLNLSNEQIFGIWVKNITSHPIFRYCIVHLFNQMYNCPNFSTMQWIHRLFIEKSIPIYELKEFNAVVSIDKYIKDMQHLSLLCIHSGNRYDFVEFYIDIYIKNLSNKKVASNLLLADSPHVAYSKGENIMNGYESMKNVLFDIMVSRGIPSTEWDMSVGFFRFMIKKLMSYSAVSSVKVVEDIITLYQKHKITHKYPYNLLCSIVCNDPYNVCHPINFFRQFLVTYFRSYSRYQDYYEIL